MPESYPQRAFAPPPDATEVVLVRHGASAAAVPGEPFEEVEGQSDPPLAPEGERQARAAGPRPRAGRSAAGARRGLAARVGGRLVRGPLRDDTPADGPDRGTAGGAHGPVPCRGARPARS